MLADFEKLSKPETFRQDEKKLKEDILEALDSAVKNLVSGLEEIPIAFSGGLDSSIVAYLAAKYGRPVLYCAGFEGSHDVVNAQKSFERSLAPGASGAKLLFSPRLEIIRLDDLDLKIYLEKTIELVGTDNKLVTDLNVPLFIIAERLKRDGCSSFLSGQGADTLFGGFAKYAYAKNFQEEEFEDIRNIRRTNLDYNFKVCDYFGVKPLFPFLEDRVVELAVETSPDLKIKSGVQKHILRQAFEECLPEEILKQNKKSFQYGSGIHKALARIRKDR